AGNLPGLQEVKAARAGTLARRQVSILWLRAEGRVHGPWERGRLGLPACPKEAADGRKQRGGAGRPGRSPVLWRSHGCTLWRPPRGRSGGSAQGRGGKAPAAATSCQGPHESHIPGH
ncbi:unnamed protein product, partial [Symbiodinium sp. CCMP2456]